MNIDAQSIPVFCHVSSETRMAKIEVIGWREGNAGYTAWDDHAKKELAKRLRRALEITSGEVKSLVKNICARQLTVIDGLRENELESVQQILHTMGADIRVSTKR